MDYSMLTDNKEAFTKNVFRLFTNTCGGSPESFASMLYGKYTVEDFAYGDDMYYWGVLKYFTDVVVPHKIAVFEAGMRLLHHKKLKHLMVGDRKEEFAKNLWIHDMSKFSANEAFGYAMHDFKNPHAKSKEGFYLAWHHHKMNNPHHPEYWLNPNSGGALEPLPMPDIYILEMIADWEGAGKTYGSSIEEWLPKNISRFKFSNRSRVAEIIRDATDINVKMENGVLIVE